MRFRFVVFAVALLAASAAHSADGVIEINQARALSGGVTADDKPGFPVTISTPGSYLLTSDLDVTSTTAYAIDVTADHVTIDLGGFTIAGPVTCTGYGSAVTCTPAAGNRGISASSQVGIRIERGNIRGFGGHAVYVGDQSRLTGLTVEFSGSGIRAGSNAEVRDCITQRNRNQGIEVSADSVVTHNVSRSNGQDGILASYGAAVIGNSSADNGGRGLFAYTGCVVRDNATRANEGTGIDTGSGCVVSDNATADNLGNGIYANTGSTVQRNTAFRNTGTGIMLGTNAGYRENVINLNTGGTVSGGVSMGNNLCNGSSTCP